MMLESLKNIFTEQDCSQVLKFFTDIQNPENLFDVHIIMIIMYYILARDNKLASCKHAY